MSTHTHARDQAENEQSHAKEYWASLEFNSFYTTSHHWSRFIARRIADLQPIRVLEFGCNAGRNLHEIRQLLPSVELLGIDINEAAVLLGREKYGFHLTVGDESALRQIATDEFDIVFTVSVIDHLPDPTAAMGELLRIARIAALFLEPFTGTTGRVDLANTVEESDPATALTAIPYTYSWDYVSLLNASAPEWSQVWTPYPLSPHNLGPYYWLIECTRPAGVRPRPSNDSGSPGTTA